MLIVLSGLPGTGKTTIARALVGKRSAVYVRVDEFEHPLKARSGFAHDIGAAGYAVAFAIASSNLKLGNMVVADSVNPVRESRQEWRDVASAITGTGLIEVEVVCSDEREHKRRVEQRASDIEGFAVPGWSSVLSHHYEPWTEPRLIVDTAIYDPAQVVSMIERQIEPIATDRRRSP